MFILNLHFAAVVHVHIRCTVDKLPHTYAAMVLVQCVKVRYIS